MAAPVLGAASRAPLQSGLYEGLQLAVAPDGAIAVSFAQESGVQPVRGCEFTLTGRLDPTGTAANVVLHSPVSGQPTHRGRLSASRDGVALTVSGLEQLPGDCDTLAALQPSDPIEFSRTGAADGTWFATVTAVRARFHAGPTGEAGRGYIVKDDPVAIGRRQGARWAATYAAPDGHKTRGWIDAADLSPCIASFGGG